MDYETINEELTPKWVLGKLICCIISIVLSVFVGFQALAVGFYNAVSGSDDLSGFAGILTAGIFLVTGIVGLATRKSPQKAPSIVCCVFYWGAFFLSRVCAGVFGDLEIWGYVGFLFGCLFLLSICRSKKSWIICLAICLAYFLLGIA